MAPRLCLGSGEEQQVSNLKKIQKSSLKQTPKLKRRRRTQEANCCSSLLPLPEEDGAVNLKTWRSTGRGSIIPNDRGS